MRDDVVKYVVEHLYAGRIENSQVAVYLVYAGARGHTAVDRELHVPRSWTWEPHRCRAAGLAEDTVFVTKPELARTRSKRSGTHGALVRTTWPR